MKLVKAIKQLKFWSKKKKRKKGLEYHRLVQCHYSKLYHDHEYTHLTYNPSPPPLRPPPPLPPQPSSLCQCLFSGSPEPSAPPLPPHFNWDGPISSSSETTKCYTQNDLESTHEIYSSRQYDWGDHITVSQEMSDTTTPIVTTKSYIENDFGSVDMNDHLKQSEMPDSPTTTVTKKSCWVSANMNDHLKQSEMPDLTVAERLECGGVATSGIQQAENPAGLFGCVVDVGALLFRCLIPCFRVSEYSDNINYSNRSVEAVSIADVGKKIV